MRRSRQLLLSFLVLLASAALLHARAGGGGGFHGGGGHSGGFSGGGGHGGGSGGGGDLLYLLYWIVRLCFVHPLVGVPIVAAMIVVLYLLAKYGGNTYQSSVLTNATFLTNQNRQDAAIAAIRQHDPQFDPVAFRARVTGAFLKIQDAWCAQNLMQVRMFVSDAVAERFTLQFAEQQEMGFRDQMQDIQVRTTQLIDAQSAGVFDCLSMRITATAIDYRVNLTDGRYREGNRSPELFSEVWSFLRRRGTLTDSSRSGLLEGNCPNCGAAITLNQSAQCDHCQAQLLSGQYDWVLTEITQNSQWQATDYERIGGLNALRQRDAGFDPQALEDRASVIFWRKTAADRIGKIDPLRKVVLPDFSERYATTLIPNDAGGRSFDGECAVGSVNLIGVLPSGQGQSLDRLLVQIRWAGKRMSCRGGQAAKVFGESVIRTSLIVLGRKAGATTNADKSISSAHCPNCGGAETHSESNACEYCGAVMNDGSIGWVLVDWLSSADDAARQLIQQAGSVETDPSIKRPADASLLEWAVSVAMADGQINSKERALLDQFAASAGMNQEGLRSIIEAAKHGSLHLPTIDADHIPQKLSALAAMALADGVLDRNEIAQLKSLGSKAGLNDYDLNLLIKRTTAEQYQAAKTVLQYAKQNPSK